MMKFVYRLRQFARFCAGAAFVYVSLLTATKVCTATPIVHVDGTFLETPKIVFSAFLNRNLYDLRFREANRDLVFISRPSVESSGGVFFFNLLEKEITKPVEVFYFEQFDLHDLAIDSRGSIVIGDRPNNLIVKPSLRFYSKKGGQIKRNVLLPFNEFNGLSPTWDLVFDRQDWFSPVLSRCDYYEIYRCLTPANYLDASVYRVIPGYTGKAGEKFHPAGSLDGYILPDGKRLEVVTLSYAKPNASAPNGVPYFAVNLTVPIPNPPPPTGAIYTMDPPLQRQVTVLPMPPTDMVVDPLTGQLYVSTANAVYRIVAPESSLAIPVKVADGFVHASTLTIDPSGNLYVMDDRSEPALAECPTGETCGNATLWKLFRGDGHMLRVFLSGDTEGQFEDGSLMPGGERNVEIPLGANLALQFVKVDLTNVQPTKIIKGSIVVESMKVDSIPVRPPGDALFKDNTIIQFADRLPHDAHGFVSVHLGLASLKFVPDDTAIKPVIARIKIVANTRGTMGSHDKYDDAISELSNSRGIPPHFIKGQIQNEGGTWNELNYRYEPLSYDYTVFSGQKGSNNPACKKQPKQMLRQSWVSPFALSNGANIRQEDRLGRSLGNMKTADPLRREATDAPIDDAITAYSFFYNNDPWWHWTGYVDKKTQNWVPIGDPCLISWLANHPQIMAFPAQTSIAASYGFLQVMWSTAIDVGWKGYGANGDKNPSYLFDTPDNVLNGGGSLTLGTAYTVNHFRSKFPADDTSPTFTDVTEFKTAFALAFQMYNPGKDGYGPLVITYSELFMPRAAGSVFP